MTYLTGAPPRGLRASASILTVRVAASNELLLIVTSGREGWVDFTTPVNALPSNFRSTLTGLRSWALGPQSPVQVPLNGSGAAPPWANAVIANRKHAISDSTLTS